MSQIKPPTKKIVPSDAEVLAAAREKGMITPRQIEAYFEARKNGQHYGLALRTAGLSMPQVISLDKYILDKKNERAKRASQRLNAVNGNNAHWYDDKRVKIGLGGFAAVLGAFVIYYGARSVFGGETSSNERNQVSYSNNIEGKLYPEKSGETKR